MKSRFRTALGVVTLGVAVIVASLSLSAGSVAANERPEKPEQFVTIIWEMDNYPEHNTIWPQTLVDHVVTDTPSLGAFDNLLTGNCVGYQVDVYKYTKDKDVEKVDNLINGGVLYGPNNPPEPLISGGEGKAWKFYKNDDCRPRVEVTEPFIVTSVSCGTPDSLEVPTQENISFFYGENEVSGQTFYGPLDGTVTAVANEGYVLIGDSEWPFVLKAATECPPESTTTTQPTTTTTVAPTTAAPIS